MATLDSVKGDKSERDPDFYSQGGWGDEDARQIVLDTIAAHNLALGLLLDAGCGDGRFAHEWDKAGFSVVACDVSFDAIQTGRKRDDGVEYLLADLEEPRSLMGRPHYAPSFDVIYCRGISHTGRPRDERSDAVFRNLAVVLRSQGILILERNTDGTGEAGPSAYFPGQTRANPTAEQLCSLIEPFFEVEEVRLIDGGDGDDFGIRRIQIRARKRPATCKPDDPRCGPGKWCGCALWDE